jgi:alcohol dehydrogenase
VTENPGLKEIQAAIEKVDGQNFDCIVAFGGGSAIDFAKSLAAGLASGSGGQDLRAIVSHPESLLENPPLPIHAIPTTSGTGSEVTHFATIWDYENRRKLSLTSQTLAPKTALVDSELTDLLPANATLSSGLDALNQAFESVWNKNSSPITVVLASRAISLALEALPALHQNLSNTVARDKMAEASLLAGLCINQTRTAICHSISYPLTAHFGVPHGVACAFTMAEVLSLCVEQTPSLFDTVISATGHHSAEALRDRIRALLLHLGVSARVRAAVGTVDSVLALKGEMVTVGRSDNFVIPVDNNLLQLLLTKAFFESS